MEAIFIIGRILFGGFFLIMGMNHFMKLKMMAMYAKSKGIPAPGFAVVISGLLLLLGGLGIIFWTNVLLAGQLLILFLLPAAIVMHNFWAITDPQDKMTQMVNFLKNMAFIGALLIVLTFI